MIKWKRSSNGINGLRENDQWFDDPMAVKEKVKEFFKKRFDGGAWQQVMLDNTEFTRISDEDNRRLKEIITKEEIKNAVWSCEGSKSPGSYGFNFGFIKLCWEEIKSYIINDGVRL